MADELNDWLRRSARRPRPTATGATAGPTATRHSACSTRCIGERRRSVAARRARVWALMPAAVIAAAAVVLLVVMLTSPAQPASRQPVAVAPVTLRPAAKLLTPFSSCDALLAGLAGARRRPRQRLLRLRIRIRAQRGIRIRRRPRRARAGRPGSQRIQRRGCTSRRRTGYIHDERPGDRRRRAGHRQDRRRPGRHASPTGVCGSSTARPAPSPDRSTYRCTPDWQSAQLFTAGDTRSCVLLHSRPVRRGRGLPRRELVPVTPSSARLRSTVLYVDLAGAPKVAGTMQADGDIVDARMVGSTVRLVVTSSPHLSVPAGADASPASSPRSASSR